MVKTDRNQAAELRAMSRMAIDALNGITSLVEAIHASIAHKPVQLAGPIVGGAIQATTGLVYKSIRGATRALGAGIERALRALEPVLRELDSSPVLESVIAALNGVLGDRLAGEGSPLAVSMHLRRDGKPLPLRRDALAAVIAAPTGRLLLLAHGLCMNDRAWSRSGHDYGADLERDLGFTRIYLRYNTGLHISTNGRQLADLLDALVAAWPVPVGEISVVAHSMGGLVVRSACREAAIRSCAWLGKVRHIVFLGTPHHGVPLERIGHWLELLWESTPFTAPFARLGKVRSAGITDLRHGYVLDEHWEGHDRFAKGSPLPVSVPLPEGVQCYAIAAAVGRTRNPVRDRWIGDGLVPVPSALGKHRNALRRLNFPASHQWVVDGANHLDLLNRPDVYERIRGWLTEAAATAASDGGCSQSVTLAP